MLLLLQKILARAVQNYFRTTTIALSWHVQNYELIGSFESQSEPNQFQPFFNRFPDLLVSVENPSGDQCAVYMVSEYKMCSGYHGKGYHEDVIKRKHFPRYWPSVRGIHRGPGTQRQVTQSFDVLFDLRLNKRLSKQWWGWWLETLSRPLWRHRSDADYSCGRVWLILHVSVHIFVYVSHCYGVGGGSCHAHESAIPTNDSLLDLMPIALHLALSGSITCNKPTQCKGRFQ